MSINRVMASLANATVPLSFLLFLVCILQCCHATGIMTADQSIVEGQILISAGGITVLGIWKPGNSQNRYLGIWFKVDPTPVWIANRENPLTDSSGVLKIDTTRRLVLSSGTGRTFWSSSNASAVSNKPRFAQLLDSGNLVLIEDGNIVWQSFDHPADTLLSGMKLGLDRKTGINQVLTAWRSLDDPFPGNFSAGIEPSGFPQWMTWNKSVRFFRAGPWNGIGFSGIPEMKAKSVFNFSFVNNQDEISYTVNVLDTSTITRMVLKPTGVLHRFIWSERNKSWITIWPHPKDQCDYYGVCGPFAYCNSDDWPVCSCLEGFEPKSPPDWDLKDFSQGCVRSTSFNCGIDDGFSLLRGMKLPDTSLALVDESLSLKDCESRCLENCSCAAYAHSNINGGGTGCVIWTGNLVDLRSFPVNGDDFYIRTDSWKLDKYTVLFLIFKTR